MENLNNKKLLNITAFIILIGVPFLKFFSMNLQEFKIINNYDNINPAILLYISVPILLYIYISDIVIKKRKLDKFDYIFFILVFTGIISCIFSINKYYAIFGKEYRHEGFLSILSYYLIMMNFKVNAKEEEIKKYINLILVISIINSIYALLQIYTNFDFILRYEEDSSMASGMCGNPNFFGSLIVVAISFVICKMLMEKEITVPRIALLILFFISIINAQSTGPFITVIIVCLFLIIFLKTKKQLISRNIIVLFIVLISTYSYIYLIDYLKVKVLSNDSGSSMRCEMCIKELKSTITSGGNGRLDIWSNTLGFVKDNYITGVGFDNFILAYPNPKPDAGVKSAKMTLTNILLHRRPEYNYYLLVDNAHNVYLHILASTGILGLIPYLIFCLLTFIKGLKSKNKLVFILLSGFIAYSVQAFANISVIQVAPIYFVLIGLILSASDNKNKSLT